MSKGKKFVNPHIEQFAKLPFDMQRELLRRAREWIEAQRGQTAAQRLAKQGIGSQAAQSTQA